MARGPRKHAPAKPLASAQLDPSPADRAAALTASFGAVTAAVAGMAAAWIAAGATGLLGLPLRHALVWLAVAVALLAGWPRPKWAWADAARLAVAVVAAAAMIAPAWDVANVLAVAVVLAAVASTARGVDRKLLAVAAAATAVFGVWRLAVGSIPTVWSLADRCGLALGRVAETLWNKPLWVGATFGGVDFLVLSAAVLAGWLISTRPPRAARGVCAGAAVALAHLAYLTVLAFSSEVAAALPAPPPVLATDLYEPVRWSWSEAAASLVPWNVPLVAAVLHLAVAALMFRWARWSADVEGQGHRGPAASARRPGPIAAAVVILAAAIPPLVMLCWNTSDLTGKTIVAFDEGYLDWEKPVYDSYGQDSAGMCGMLPTFVASLGGTFVHSAELAEDDLAAADVLVLIHPVRPWPKDRMDRVWRFVRGGGSLLVAGEPRVHEEGFVSAFDEVLAPSPLRLRFDTAISRTGQWRQSRQVMPHPATTGVGGRRNRFGIVTGSSIDLRWPARPILVGRFGWSDPGSDAVMTDASRYNPGEKLGDLVLAAEARVGRGSVVVLGDTVSLTNEGNVDCYPFTGRLLSYLANRPSSPQAAWRQALGLAACLLLAGLLLCRPEPARPAVVAVAVALAAAGCMVASGRWSRVLPDAKKVAPGTRIACIDASHLEAFSDFGWVYDGIAGLKLTLMRNGYLPLLLPELTAERLAGVEMLIAIAPARRFTRSEREAVAAMVRSGGILIATTGAEQSRATNGLVAPFGLGVPRCPVGAGENADEPRPMGHFRTPYLDAGDYQPHLIFYAGWPISCPAGPNTEVLVRGFDDLPVVGASYVGKGAVVVIGDTDFAMNKNLEYVGGEPFDGAYENAHFWRWLIAKLTDRPPWIPPKPEQTEAAPAEGQEAPAERQEAPAQRQEEGAAEEARDQPGPAPPEGPADREVAP